MIALVAALWIAQIEGAAAIIALTAAGLDRLVTVIDIIARTGE